MDREKPVASPEQVADAKMISGIVVDTVKSFGPLGFARGKETEDAIAAFLAARDAETIRPWREAVTKAMEFLERGCHCYCYRCPCDMNNIRDARPILDAMLDAHPVPNKGESHG